MIRSSISLLLICLALTSFADDIPQYADSVHLGVASCASGVCHGSVKPRTATRVLQNEYVVWSRLDRHRNAYNILLTEESKWIARNMGLPNAHEADVCLDCHADNVPEELRGAKFQISDGIGCEACHGGAESWLMSHTEQGRGHAANVEDGLYPLDDVQARAKLCFSCHIGDENKIASHEIMGAGHPRLAFELDTFGILQPAHYVVDDDYREDKWHGTSLQTWAYGQIAAAKQTLLLAEEWLDTNRRFPELSLFDCHACHHPMSDLRWQPGDEGLPPGAVRLNDAGFVMLFPLARQVAPDSVDGLSKAVRKLHTDVVNGSDISSAMAALRTVIGELEDATAQMNNAAAPLLNDLVRMGKRGDFHDYVAAEQAVMAVDLMLSAVGQRDENGAWLDRLYGAVADEDQYSPAEFRAAMSATPEL